MGASEVAAGATWLDENFPGWEREIDLGTLDIEDCSACICGQSLAKYVVGRLTGYDVALAAAIGTNADRFTTRRMAIEWAREHGFYVDGGRDNELAIEGIWRDLIKERFSSGNLSDN